MGGGGNPYYFISKIKLAKFNDKDLTNSYVFYLTTDKNLY